MAHGIAVSTQDQAREDAYTLVRAEELKTETNKIRKSPKRFAAAVKIIKKENEERRRAIQKETAARSAAVKS